MYIEYVGICRFVVANQTRNSCIVCKAVLECVINPCSFDVIKHRSISSLALQYQFGPWPASMKLSVSLRFTRS
jgi:hypothetical protein